VLFGGEITEKDRLNLWLILNYDAYLNFEKELDLKVSLSTEKSTS